MVKGAWILTILRTLYFYTCCAVSVYAVALLMVLWTFVLLPLYLYDKKAILVFNNKLLFLSVYIGAFFLHRNWKCIFLSDIPKDEGKKRRIYMLNHLSYSDPFVVSILGIKTPLAYTYKDSLHKIPLLFPVLPICGHLAISFIYDKVKDVKMPKKGSVAKLMKDCKKSMDLGFNICVHPEGKRSRNGVLQEFKDGYFRFAIEHQCEIVPCAISNSQELWPMRTKFTIGKGTSYIRVGSPISPKGKTVAELKLETRKAIYENMKMCPSFNKELETVEELEN